MILKFISSINNDPILPRIITLVSNKDECKRTENLMCAIKENINYSSLIRYHNMLDKDLIKLGFDDDDCDDHDMVTIPHGLTLGWSFPLQKRKNSSLLSRRRVAWFTFDPLSAPPDIIFTNNNLTATCNNFDHRVILGGVGFSKGIHYWEVQIDRYENNSDPAIGIARFDVDKFSMLGKEDKGWSMYIDDKRSWFLHHDEHSNRTEGGIHRGGVVGVLLDLDQHTLSYFVGDEPHGPIAFTDLHGVYFPAVSINRNVQVTIRTGLEPPIESDDDDEADV
ncbi:hypothetical protein ACJMK2_036696 [Sinanodonta woodiana]|uniref:B30.2/SPRY domain-containing protein n=1 Tax=Sinanodonta woodiana TaxID=1069815 RepID=A0ABD3WJD9_SINWO